MIAPRTPYQSSNEDDINNISILEDGNESAEEFQLDEDFDEFESDIDEFENDMLYNADAAMLESPHQSPTLSVCSHHDNTSLSSLSR